MLSTFLAAVLLPAGDGPPATHTAAPGRWSRLGRLVMEADGVEKYGLAGGVVVEVTADTLTVRDRSGFRRTFEASPALASKRIPLEAKWRFGHRLNQVRVGDFVALRVTRTWRGAIAIEVGIHERPWGFVPPAEDEHLHPRMRLHYIYNRDNLIARAARLSPWLGRLVAFAYELRHRAGPY
jgi:hypothetical protein